MKLQDKLNNLDKYPFHMPGHKRNAKFDIVGANIDVTEISDTDDLHNPKDIILDVENKLQSIYKSKKSFMLVNGSTVGILASIFAVCNKGDKIIVARNCHKSVFNACLLLELDVVYVEPEFDSIHGYYAQLDQANVNDALREHPDAKAVVITSPSYEGDISNISVPIPLIVDSAHGAHLGISYFPSYPKGDIVVSSLHKTLPALTQTAVLNVYNDEYIARVKRFVDIFETSSPSYVLMNSVAQCVDFVINNRKEFDDYYARLMDFRCTEFENLMLQYTSDPSKLIVSTAYINITSVELADILRNKFNIEVEMVGLNYVLLMTSVGDEKEAFDMLKQALLWLDEHYSSSASNPAFQPPKLDNGKVAYPADVSQTDIGDAVGKVSAEFVFAYPPDIPILAPNQIITNDIIMYLKKEIELGANLVSDSGLLPNKLLTKCNR